MGIISVKEEQMYTNQKYTTVLHENNRRQLKHLSWSIQINFDRKHFSGQSYGSCIVMSL